MAAPVGCTRGLRSVRRILSVLGEKLRFFVAHGDHDTYVPVSGAREFAEKLRAISRGTVVYAELPGAQHSFNLFRSPRFESVVDAVEAFLENVPSREGA
jgi:dipeptidyl aminopeptidase/acylaminoacyl peptidase